MPRFGAACVMCVLLLRCCAGSAAHAAPESTDRAMSAGGHSKGPRYSFGVRLEPASRSFRVNERIELTIEDSRPLDELLLQVYADVGAARPAVTMVRGSCMPICDVRFEAPAAILVRPTLPLPAGARLQIDLSLVGTWPAIPCEQTGVAAGAITNLAALKGVSHPDGYGLLAEGQGIVVLANFYAVLGRRHGAIWERISASAVGDLGSDEVATYHAVVDAPAHYRVVTNGDLVSQRSLPSTPSSDPRQLTEWIAPWARDLVVVASERLQKLQEQVRGVTVESYFLPEDRRAAEHVLHVACAALAFFERRFGPYPYKRLSVVEAALVGGAGGVEFSGMALIASSLYGSGQGSACAQDPSDGLGVWGRMLSRAGLSLGPQWSSMREFVTAHEVAHQWWHVLVGTDSREHPFADESLTQWSSLLYWEDRYGLERAQQQAMQQVELMYWLMRLAGESDSPVDRPVTAFASDLAYAGIVYAKGVGLYRQLRALLGDEPFFRGLRAYAAEYRFRNAPSDALFEQWTHGDKERAVRALVDRWLHQRRADDDLAMPNLAGLLPVMQGGQRTKETPAFERAVRELLGSGTPAKGGLR